MHDVARPVLNRPTQSPPKRRWKAIAIAVALLLAIGVFVIGVKFLQIGKMMSTPHTMPPTTVTSASVKEEDWAPRLTAVGSVSPVQGAVVSAELAGVVSEINFNNGAEAKKGDQGGRADEHGGSSGRRAHRLVAGCPKERNCRRPGRRHKAGPTGPRIRRRSAAWRAEAHRCRRSRGYDGAIVLTAGHFPGGVP